MIDGVIRKSIEEAIRFLGKGSVYRCEVDTHEVSIVRRSDGVARYLVVCHSCSSLVADDAELRRVYPKIHKHTEVAE